MLRVIMNNNEYDNYIDSNHFDRVIVAFSAKGRKNCLFQSKL